MFKTSLIEMCIVLASGAYDPLSYTVLEIDIKSENIHAIAYTPEDKKHITDLLCKSRDLTYLGKGILVVKK